MGLIQNITSKFSNKEVPQKQILTKKPGFSITGFNANNPFTSIIEPETNYFEQNILYVSKSIDYRANKVASVDIMLTDGEQEVDKNDLMADLQRFNPFMNLWEARKLKEMHLDLTGAAAWYIDREPMENKIVEFYPLDPTQLDIMTDSSGLPAYYSYRDGDGKVVYINTNDLIYFKRMNPQNWFEGQSAIKNILYWSNAYAQGAQYNQNKLGNNSSVDKFLVFEGISKENREQLEDKLRTKYSGPKNAGRTSVVAQKPEVVDMSSNQKDLDYVEGMKMLRQDILAYFGIPEALLFPSATNSNTKEAARIFQADTLEPLIKQECAALNEQLLKKVYGNKIESFKYVFKFDQVVESDMDALVSQASTLYEKGIYTRNQALTHIGDNEVDDGDVYNNSSQPVEESTSKDTDVGTDIDTEKASKSVSVNDRLVEIVNKQQDQIFKTKAIKFQDDQEGIFFKTTESLFEGQAKRAINYIEKTDKVAIRNIFDIKKEMQITKQIYKDTYENVLSNSNTDANMEVKTKLLSLGSPKFTNYKEKSLSPQAINAIVKKLDYFAGEINETTSKRLKKLIKQGIDEGFDKAQFKNAIAKVFNDYIDGSKNVDILTKLGIYVDKISVSQEGGVVVSSSNRYNAMLERLTQAQSAKTITAEEFQDGLKALRGVIDPSDPIGKQVDGLLSSLYKVNKFEGISESRAITIARTESTFASNLGFYDTYIENPFVKGRTWNNLRDRSVRPWHQGVKSVEIDEPFLVDGQRMLFPGDTSLGAAARNVVNCRCRVTAIVNI